MKEESEQIQITLKLYSDQSDLSFNPDADLVWEFFVNGQPFPEAFSNCLTTTQAMKVARMLIDIEEVCFEQK